MASWPAEVQATVAEGEAGYRVRARLDDVGALELSCGCERAAGLEPCGHLWSLVCVLEGRRRVAAFEGDTLVDVTLRYGAMKRRIAVIEDAIESAPSFRPQSAAPPSPDTLPSAPWMGQSPRGPQASCRATGEAPSSWRRPFDRLRDQLAVAPSRVDGVLPRVGSCVLELHVQREPRGPSQLRLMGCWRRVLSDGSFGGFERGGASDRRQLTRAERRQLERLGGTSIAYANSWTTTVTVPREAAATVLAELGGPSSSVARFGWVDAADEDGRGVAPLVPLRWDGDEPFEPELVLRSRDDGGLSARCALRRGSERFDLDELVQWADGVAIVGERILRTDESATAWLASLGEPLRVARADVDDFFAQLAATPDLPPIDLDSALGVEVRSESPRPRLSIERTGGPLDQQLPVTIEVRYGKEAVPIELATSATWDAKRHVLWRRDLDAEASLLSRLGDLGFRATERAGTLMITVGAFEAGAATLLDEGWDLRAKKKPIRHGRSLSLSLASNEDWFELEGEVRFDQGTASLPDLLKCVSRNERWVTLDDGSRGVVPRSWLDDLGAFVDGEAVCDRMRYSPAQAALLEVDHERLDITVDEGLERLRAELASAERIEPVPAPDGFVGELRPYQAEGLGWFAFLRRFRFGGCLADDMGLGKTIQVLALLEGRRARPREPDRPRCSLVVAPRSLLFNWAAEAARFAPELTVGTYHGAARRRLSFEDHDLVLTTYGTLRRDRERMKAERFDYVILDEAQAIKNPRSIAAKACRELSSEHRLALSGTPIENHLGDLASLFDFLNPGMSRTVRSMRALATTLAPDPEQRRTLASALRPFILRRTKGEVLDDLPSKTEQILHCELSTRERREYDDLASHYRGHLKEKIERDGFARSRFNVLEALLRLRQAACHPGLMNEGRRDEGSAKVDLLMAHLDELVGAGHKALVFSQFTTLLRIVADRLDERGHDYAYLDGATRDRAVPVERFQREPACGVFLLSLKAGNAGLNLTAADYVFLLDPWWNPAVEAQAIDRAHRIGQTRPVVAYRLVAKDTVEDRVVALSGQKRELARDVLGAPGRTLSGFDASDLEGLLG